MARPGGMHASFAEEESGNLFSFSLRCRRRLRKRLAPSFGEHFAFPRLLVLFRRLLFPESARTETLLRSPVEIRGDQGRKTGKRRGKSSCSLLFPSKQSNGAASWPLSSHFLLPSFSPFSLLAPLLKTPNSAAAAAPSAAPSSLLSVAAAAAVANAVAASPAFAEAGKIFDFNLTLPLMAGQFLLLMVFLDKTWFGPVGKVLDERDAMLREQMAFAKDGGGELESLQKQAEEALRAARADAAAAVAAARSSAAAEQATKLAEVKAAVDRELATALAALASEKESALKNLDAQVDRLSADILGRVLPEGVKL